MKTKYSQICIALVASIAIASCTNGKGITNNPAVNETVSDRITTIEAGSCIAPRKDVAIEKQTAEAAADVGN